MAEEKKHKGGAGAAGFGGAIWFAGWLFTIAFTSQVWWKAIISIIIWPFYLGTALR